MTAPDGESPPGSIGVGGFAAWQALTESNAKSGMKGGVVGSFTNAQGSHNTQVKTPIRDTAAVVVTTGVINGQTVTRYTYTANGTWTKPAPPSGKRISRIGVGVINGGNGGNGPPGGNGEGGEGGEGGGYSYREFADGDVPSSVAVTIGAGGLGGGLNALGQVGGTSSFGSLLNGKSGTSNVVTSQGALGATSAPGRGGNGGGGGSGDSYSYRSPGLRGQSTALGIGGDGGGVNATGQAGGVTGTDPQIFSGGAGGGGGGGCAAGAGIGIPTALRPGGGGAGAAPGGGGGGGGGGQKHSNAGDWLPGGAGGNGGVAVWVYFEEITT